MVVAVLAGGGCTWLPVRGPAAVTPPAEFDGLTGGDLGAAHGYVVGIAKERLAGGRLGGEAGMAREREQALLASLDAETLPVRPDPSDPVPGRSFPAADAGARANAEAVREAGTPAESGSPQSAEGAQNTGTLGDRGDAGLFQTPLPTTAAATAPTADLNGDGFVTLDEVIALHRARVAPDEIARRLAATGFVLAATPPQLKHLRAYGVPPAALTPLEPKTRKK